MFYELYIDIFFLVNFMMDSILLLIARKILKSPAKRGRAFAGAATGAFLTCLVTMASIPYALVKFILFHAVINTVMIKIGLRVQRGREFLRAFLVLYICSFLVGGVFTYLGQYAKAGSMFFAAAVASYYIASGAFALLSGVFKVGAYRCSAVLYKDGRSYCAQGLIDTGNRLKDPVTGKPVSIISRQAAEILLGGKIPEGFRFIPYHSIGKKAGVIPLVTLDNLCITGKEEKWIEKPMVAIPEHEIASDKSYEIIINPDIT